MNFASSFLKTLASVWLLGVCWSSFATEYIDWLYEYEQPVQTRTHQEEQRVSAEGLRVVLIRVTGLAVLPENEALKQAFSNLDAYQLDTRYVSTTQIESQSRSAISLAVRFNPVAIQNLVRAAELPLWSTFRPRVLLIASTVQEGKWKVLQSKSGQPLERALHRAARHRGLLINQPVMDLIEHQYLSEGAIAFDYFRDFKEMNRRYGTDMVATIGLAPIDLNRYRVNLKLFKTELVGNWVFDVDSIAECGDVIVDAIVDHLTAIYAVQSTARDVLQLAVDGIDSTTAYRTLLRYLEKWDFIDEVILRSLVGERLEVELHTATTWVQFSTYLDIDQLLVVDGSGDQASHNTRYFTWRGSK